MEILADTHEYDFIFLSETHLTDETDENEIRINGFNNVSCLSNSTRTGGTTIYIRNRWNIKKITRKAIDWKMWLVACNVKCKDLEMVIVAIYRSPSHSERSFCDFFEENLDIITESTNNILITGDFNIDWCKNDTYKREIERVLNDNCLMQKIFKNNTYIEYYS